MPQGMMPRIADERSVVVIPCLCMLVLVLNAGCGQQQSKPPDAFEVGEPTAVIEMTDNMMFLPENLTVKSGATVVWINRGNLPHTTTDNPVAAAVPEHNTLPAGAESWDSKTLQTGQTFQQVFQVPGIYTYSCTLHEVNGMIGKIIVN